MQVSFTQVYIESGASFPFSHLFQRCLSEAVTALVEPSVKFRREYGDDFELIFYISAKHDLLDNEIRGPTVFKKAKDVEYTIFLPFDVIVVHTDAPRHAVSFLLDGICEVFRELEVDYAKLLNEQKTIIDAICSDRAMLAAPSWNQAENHSHVRTLFAGFFEKNAKSHSAASAAGGRIAKGRSSFEP